LKPGEHILRGHLRHNRRRTKHSDAFSGGARPGRRHAFEGGAEHSTRKNKALVGSCVRVLRSEGVPRPQSTFADELLSVLSTLWSQKLRAKRWSSFKIQHIAHFVLSSFTLYPNGTPCAQALFRKFKSHIFPLLGMCEGRRSRGLFRLHVAGALRSVTVRNEPLYGAGSQRGMHDPQLGSSPCVSCWS
jgi:hypothetical protein